MILEGRRTPANFMLRLLSGLPCYGPVGAKETSNVGWTVWTAATWTVLTFYPIDPASMFLSQSMPSRMIILSAWTSYTKTVKRISSWYFTASNKVLLMSVGCHNLQYVERHSAITEDAQM